MCVGCALVALATPAAAQDAPAAEPVATARPVDILNYRIEGNSVLSRVEVETAVLPYLGPQRPQDDVEKARAALEKVYRDKGYETVAVEIPEQEVRDGVVRLQVTELAVGRLRVTGARFFSSEDIKKRAPSLAEGNVPNYKQVSDEIAALNKSGERTITPALRAGDTPGTVDVDLQVEDQAPLHGTLELNDRASAQTERLRLSASLIYANLWQLGHSLSVQGQFTPQDPAQSWIVSGSYVAPIQGTPFAVVVYGVHSDSDVAAVGGINVLGSGDIVGVRGIYNFSQGDWKHTLTLGLDYKNFQEDLVLGPEFGRTPISYMPLTLQYATGRTGERSEFSFTAGVNVGLRGLDADELEFRLKRFNASASWSSLRLDASYSYTFKNDIRYSWRVAGQLADEPLISNEEFSIGGWDSVRGYFESQELGDIGVSSQFDLYSPSLAGLIGKGVDEWRFYGFADWGYTRILDALPDIDGNIKADGKLASLGLGTRLRLAKYVNIDALLAAPLIDPGDTLTDFDGKLRGQFRLWFAF
ncbi:ShlB/FhaC/HecB family hemolysin secretion/activation protein [Sphingomonas sp. BT-65]|uniref:ShlB/FhaC/HecB family hemolysin secretion/activation protein n=1 Tax=Sphingomonas sp. BT-65 TaxID=2989821 RepID=UPI0022361E87|nr:ShlB/FhaC/HecB family hemolysin secretion/activation protein [Sphingomonas sp. BT-65]MCW4460669.1 ShlB/FhaC/HecB family hemolysin secretion/activation protein [Sphingomonas sp. BT-65]